MRPQPKAIAMACVLATLFASTGAMAQQTRLSLADRVAALEARDQGEGQANIDLLNRIAQLESDVKALRAQVEQMQNDNQQAKDQAKAKYIDLDSRLSRLEAAAPAASAPSAAAKPPPARPAAAQQPTPAGATPSAPSGGVSNTSAPAPAVSDQAAYQSAFDAMKAEHYADSAQKFRAFVQQYPDSSLAPNAYYWMGESYYVTQNYQYALTAFQAVIDHYPDSPKTVAALLKIGYCQDGLKQHDAAQATLHQVISKYPNSEEAGQAQSRLRAMSMDPGG